ELPTICFKHRPHSKFTSIFVPLQRSIAGCTSEMKALTCHDSRSITVFSSFVLHLCVV
ncbi:unnamed protein product, partial [Musa acuminata subsp. burmannicoides]